MKKIIAAVVAAIMLALLCTSCFFSDPLVVSHKYADKFCGTWEGENGACIEVEKDDDTIGCINSISSLNGSSNYSDGGWRIDYKTLTVNWDSSEPFSQSGSEKGEKTKIIYTYANKLNEGVIEQGKDAIQKVLNRQQDEHFWYVSDKYLCFDDHVFTSVKDR